MAIVNLNHLPYKRLTWNDPCPIGKNKGWLGKPLRDVDPGYLLWLYKQEWLNERHPDLYSFIRTHHETLVERNDINYSDASGQWVDAAPVTDEDRRRLTRPRDLFDSAEESFLGEDDSDNCDPE